MKETTTGEETTTMSTFTYTHQGKVYQADTYEQAKSIAAQIAAHGEEATVEVDGKRVTADTYAAVEAGMADAARHRQLSPVQCPKCDGLGTYWDTVDGPDSHIEYQGNVMCGRCEGSGLVEAYCAVCDDAEDELRLATYEIDGLLVCSGHYATREEWL